MKYLLTVLTNGRPHYLERSLAAFAEHVTPAPEEVYVHDDGLRTSRADLDRALAPIGGRIVLAGSAPGLGMCRAHADCWNQAAESEYEWVFHLEDDYRVLCPIDLRELAAVITRRRYLLQMTLMRTPWGAEVEHGGYVPMATGHYDRAVAPAWIVQACSVCGAQVFHDQDGNYDPCDECDEIDSRSVAVPGARWFETTRNWSAAPTLFPTELARHIAWPLEDGCETTVGQRMLQSYPDARFGIWGAGECHVAHIGVDRARGAYGY